MTASSPSDRTGAAAWPVLGPLRRWWHGKRGAAFRNRWVGRRDRFAAIEVLGGTVIMALWAVLATIALGALWFSAMCLILALWLHFAAVETGSYSLLWMATGLILLFIVIATAILSYDFSATSFTVAAFTALVYNELVRLSFCRRRAGQIDEQVYVSSSLGMGAVALVSIIGMGLAQALAGAEDRSWLWVPVVSLVVTVLALVVTIVPGRNAMARSRQRWRPGDRIPPPPLGQRTDGFS